MKPTVGHIVHVACEHGSTLPAIITKVMGDEQIQVTVFHPDLPPENRSLKYKVPYPPKGTLDWNWPPRE